MTKNAITGTDGYNNPQYRTQKLYLKVKRYMEILKAILKDEGRRPFRPGCPPGTR